MVEKMIHAVGQPTDATGPTQPYAISLLQDKRGIYPSFGSSLDAMQLMVIFIMAAFGNYFGTIDPKAFRRFERSCCRWFGYLKNKTPTSEDTIVETEFSYLKPRCGSDDWTDEVKRFADEFGPTPSGPKGDFFCTLLSFHQTRDNHSL